MRADACTTPWTPASSVLSAAAEAEVEIDAIGDRLDELLSSASPSSRAAKKSKSSSVAAATPGMLDAHFAPCADVKGTGVLLATSRT